MPAMESIQGWGIGQPDPSWLLPAPPTPWTERLHAVREMPLKSHRCVAALVTGSLFAVAWALIWATHGHHPELGDITYGAIIVAGLYFGAPGGAAAGLTAMILLSPVGLLAHQSMLSWTVRGAWAIALGGMVGARSCLLDHAHERVKQLAGDMAVTHRRTLHLIAEAVELRDPVTAGHSHRVAVNARALGARTGQFSDPELDALYWAGLLHDVGKIAIPETILQKPGPLTTEEWALMKSHPGIGAGLISRASPDLASLAEAVASHHEHWDGTGYPYGLAGTAIPLPGRVLSVVDVFEALTSARPYRDGLPPEDALAYISERSGAHFDPMLVTLFEELASNEAIVVAPGIPTVGQLALALSYAERSLPAAGRGHAQPGLRRMPGFA